MRYKVLQYYDIQIKVKKIVHPVFVYLYKTAFFLECTLRGFCLCYCFIPIISCLGQTGSILTSNSKRVYGILTLIVNYQKKCWFNKQRHGYKKARLEPQPSSLLLTIYSVTKVVRFYP